MEDKSRDEGVSGGGAEEKLHVQVFFSSRGVHQQVFWWWCLVLFNSDVDGHDATIPVLAKSYLLPAFLQEADGCSFIIFLPFSASFFQSPVVVCSGNHIACVFWYPLRGFCRPVYEAESLRPDFIHNVTCINRVTTQNWKKKSVRNCSFPPKLHSPLPFTVSWLLVKLTLTGLPVRVLLADLKSWSFHVCKCLTNLHFSLSSSNKIFTLVSFGFLRVSCTCW